MSLGVMEDALRGRLIQETRQEQRPARMVGLVVCFLPQLAWKPVGKAKVGLRDEGGL